MITKFKTLYYYALGYRWKIVKYSPSYPLNPCFNNFYLEVFTRQFLKRQMVHNPVIYNSVMLSLEPKAYRKIIYKSYVDRVHTEKVYISKSEFIKELLSK